MKKSLCFPIFLLFSFKIMGQTLPVLASSKAVYSVGLGIGLGYTALKNETISPLIFTGFGAPISLTYRRESAISRQFLQLQYQAQTIQSPFDLPIEEVGGHLIFSYLRRIKSSAKSRFFWGAELRLEGVDRQMPKSLNSAFTVSLNSLNVNGLWDFSMGKNQFESEISVAVLGYNLRSGSNLSGVFDVSFFDYLKSNARFETLPKYLNATLRIAYFVPTNAKHFLWRVDYSGNYLGFKQRQYFGVLRNQISTSLTYQF